MAHVKDLLQNIAHTRVGRPSIQKHAIEWTGVPARYIPITPCDSLE
jgi:hypothetical protein